MLTIVNTMWFVIQKPCEDNPVHIHTNCKVSAIAYVKTPKQQVKDRKQHYEADAEMRRLRIDITERVGTLEKWKYLVIGGSIVVGFALNAYMRYMM